MASLRRFKRPDRRIQLISASSQEVADFASKFPDTADAPASCDGNTFLVRVGSEDLALVSYFVRKRELVLLQLYVLPSHRGLGIGSGIIDLLSQTEPVDTLRVIASPLSSKFYENIGFRQDMGCVVLSKEVSI